MKGDPTVVDALNGALAIEIAASNQFLLHARMMEHWGFPGRGRHEMKEAIEEMKHADLLIRRILLLEGTPRLDTPGRMRIGSDLKSAIAGDLELEREAVTFYRRAVAICEKAGDHVSRDMMVRLLAEEEEHEHHLQSELELVARIGIERYEAAMASDGRREEDD